MIVVTERKRRNETLFNYELIQDDKVIFTEVITSKSVVHEIDGYTYFLIYTKQMIPRSDAFIFLNVNLKNLALNSRIKATQGLKLLFAFEEIIGKSIAEFNLIDFDNLKSFLRGYSPTGDTFSFRLMSRRCGNTINGYFAIYRKFASFKGIKAKIPALYTTHYHSSSSEQSQPYGSKEKILISEKSNTNLNEVPWYISIDDFANILQVVRGKKMYVEEIIIRLMFQCGLRIGEVLGLTNEDLLVEEHHGSLIPVAYLRNRLSDRTFQKCKTCMKIVNINDYVSANYKLNGYGYQKVLIPEDLYKDLNDYTEKTHVAAEAVNPISYRSTVVADGVDGTDNNFYVFLNIYNGILTSQTWNIRLRRIMGEAGIHVDKGKKKHNLNHRFRHGFAMYNIQHLNIGKLELMKLMRHKSLQSIECYYRPTLSDAIELKTQLTESIYDSIPALGGMENGK